MTREALSSGFPLQGGELEVVGFELHWFRHWEEAGINNLAHYNLLENHLYFKISARF